MRHDKWVTYSSVNFHILRDEAKEHVRRRDVWQVGDFRVAMWGQLFSQAADAMTSLGLAQLLLFDLNPGNTVLAFLRGLVVAAFPLLFVGPLAGFVADRFPRQRLLVNVQILRAVLTLVAIGASISQYQPTVFVIFAILLLVTRVLYTVRATSIPQLVQKHQLVAADSLSLMLSMIAGFAGVAIAAGLEMVDVKLVFVIAAVLHLASSRCFGTIRAELGGGSLMQASRDWQTAAAQLRSHKVRYSIISSGGGKLLLGVSYACVALLIDSRFSIEATGYAAVFGVAGVGTFLGTVSAEWIIERVPRKSVSVMAMSVSALAIGVVLILNSFAVALAAIVVASFAFQNVRVCNDAAVQSGVESSSLGRVFAAYDVVYNMSFVIGAVLALSAGMKFGYFVVLAGCCAGYAALAFALLVVGSGDPRPTEIKRRPADVHVLASNTLRVSNTKFPDIVATTLSAATSLNSGHSVNTTSASAPKQAPTEVSA